MAQLVNVVTFKIVDRSDYKKIGQKELPKQGLSKVFSFKQRNTHMNLEPFLAQSSQYFRLGGLPSQIRFVELEYNLYVMKKSELSFLDLLQKRKYNTCCRWPGCLAVGGWRPAAISPI